MSSSDNAGDSGRTGAFPASMGPGARPLQPGENPGGLLQEIQQIRSHYNVHVESEAINLTYDIDGKKRHYRLPFDSIPMQGWTRTLCWGGPSSSKVSGILLVDMIRACENITGTPVRQEEAESIAFYSSRKMMTMYLGQAVSLGGGFFHAWRGKANMKFPFMKPKPLERYDVFPFNRLPVLTGNYARFMWHITRGNIYAVLYLFLLNPFFRSVADTRMTVGLYQDRRSHDLTEAIKGKVDRLRSNRASEAAQKVQSNARTAQEQNNQTQDDMSPQVFEDNQSYGRTSDFAADSTFTDGNTDTGLMTDKNVQQRDTQQTSPNSWSKAQSRGSRASSQPQQEQSQSSDFFFDDASPTAGNDPNMATPAGQSKQSGSAWSRLRGVGSQQTSSASSPRRTSSRPSQDQGGEFENRGDSFSFSKGQEDRQLAKMQAQKEFDAMLERERQEGGSNEYTRDMRAAEAGQASEGRSESAWSRRRGG